MSIIKIEREEKLDLVVDGKVYTVGWIYHVTSGENKNHAYPLTKIFKKGNDWILKLGDHSYDAEIAAAYIEDTYPLKWNYRKCECSFDCDGYVFKDWKW